MIDNSAKVLIDKLFNIEIFKKLILKSKSKRYKIKAELVKNNSYILFIEYY
jgi:hypothetical protein